VVGREAPGGQGGIRVSALATAPRCGNVVPIRGRGRPSKLTPAVQATICAAVRAGNFLEVAAESAGVSRRLSSSGSRAAKAVTRNDAANASMPTLLTRSGKRVRRPKPAPFRPGPSKRATTGEPRPHYGFDTVKPLKLFKKIIQIWCRPNGIVMDPFAGSGTTAHAVLDLNKETGSSRQFVLIEQGNTAKGDHYAKTLTADRIRRVITGDWVTGKRDPLPGGFRFMELEREKIDADAVNALAREEMIDLLLTSYWDKAERAKSYLRRLPVGTHKYLFAVNPKEEGFFLVWQAADQLSVLNREVFKEVVAEAQVASLKSRYHVYASIAPYTGAGIEFYKIPDKVLEHIGFNPRSDAFNNEENAVA
jgi:hypothetical protein